MTNSMHKMNKIAMLVGGVCLVVMGLLVKGTVSSPLILLHQWNALDCLPPMWLLRLLWMSGYFLMGSVWFGVLGMKACGAEGEILRYKGSMFLVLAVFFSFVWYLLLFGMQAAFLSWLSLGIAILMALIAAVCYCRVTALAGLGIALTLIWWVYLFLGQVVVMLHI